MMAGGGTRRIPGTGSVSRRGLLGAGLLGGAALVTGCSRVTATATAGDQMPPGDDLVIGASLELTANGAMVGKSQRNAINIAEAKINSTGVIVTNQLRKVRVIIKDNESDPNRAAAQAREFAADSTVLAIIGGGMASTAKAMAPIAEQQKIPLLATASADSIVQPIADRRFVFKLGPNASDVAKMLVDAASQQGMSRLAIVAEAGDHGDSGIAAVTTRANSAGLHVVQTVRVPVGSRNYLGQAQQVAGQQPDATVVWAAAPTSGLVARALRAAQYRGTLFFDAGAASEDALSALNRAATVNSFMVAPTIMNGRPVAVTTPAELAQVGYFEQYTQLYGAFSCVSVFAADALNLVADAAERGGRTAATRLRVRDELEATPYDGLAGQYTFQTIRHGGVDADALSLFQMRNTDWVKVN